MPDHIVHVSDVVIADVLGVMRSWRAGRLSSVQERHVVTVLESCVAGPRQADLFAAVPSREASRVARVVTRMPSGDEPCRDPLALQAVKLAMVIGDLRAGRPGCVQPWEVTAVAEVLGHDVARAPGTVAPEWAGQDHHPQDGPVGFRFPWRQVDARTPRISHATALVSLSEVNPVDAPVACSLLTPAGPFDVRRRQSLCLRPVLAPGSWEPITPADFRRAAGSGAAWRDNTFLPRVPRGCPDFHLVDPALPAAMATDGGRRLSRARDACLDRAGHLLVIGGVVHRSTTGPQGRDVCGQDG